MMWIFLGRNPGSMPYRNNPCINSTGNPFTHWKQRKDQDVCIECLSNNAFSSLLRKSKEGGANLNFINGLHCEMKESQNVDFPVPQTVAFKLWVV